MNRHIILKSDLEETFRNEMNTGRIVFFSAPCGFGKTTTAEALVEGKKVKKLSAETADFKIPEVDGTWDILLIDQFQYFIEDEFKDSLCSLIRENPQLRFLFLSRGAAPGWLAPFQFTGLMKIFQAQDLFFDWETVKRLMDKYKIPRTPAEITTIMTETLGYPLAVQLVAMHLLQGKVYDARTSDMIRREIYIYFEDAIYKRFDISKRMLLIQLAPFDGFDTNLAKMVSGDNCVGEILGEIQKNTTMLLYDSIEEFRFWPFFRDFLLWELEKEFTETQKQAIYNRGGLYYELNNDYGRAMECYASSGDYHKISELLIKNAEKDPGSGYYWEMEKYYNRLPDEEVRTSPALMQGLSMLRALEMDYEKSEYWYEQLAQYAAHKDRNDAAYKEARSRLAWLDISLPQRGVQKLTEIIPNVFQLLLNKEVTLPQFSVTSNLPSIMNGGKDFSEWSKKDDFLYATIRKPVVAVLGRNGVGLPDYAIMESKFEKGEDISSRMLGFISEFSQIHRDGTLDIEFAAAGLLARSQMDSGRAEDAWHNIQTLRKQFEEQGETRFLPNMDALLCRIALRTGDKEYVQHWYHKQAPKDPLHLNVMKRYQYLTQAMAEVMQGNEKNALLTLAPLENYCKVCGRTIDRIHMKLITAIAKYRLNDNNWDEMLCEALSLALPYRFIRTISQYGAAILPMLKITKWQEDQEFLKSVTEKARMQAIYYPDFLRPTTLDVEMLTSAEMQVLRLMCADKSNTEIGEILNIKLSTVKSHVSHILQKLGVKRRSEAKTATEKLKLL